MADARIVVLASRVDSAPGALYEALSMGCNVVASRNCGNWEACDPDLVVERYDIDGFTDKVRLALEHPRAGRLGSLLEDCPPDRVVGDLLHARRPAPVGP